MTTVSLEFSLAGRIARLTLSRPDRLNAFNGAMHGELRESLVQIEAAPKLSAVILTGAGRGFCAGQDLDERAAAFARGEPPDLGRSLAENYNPLIRRLAALPCPVIAAVNGIASGAGAALAIACDVVIAGTSARFQFGFLRVALAPDAGTSWTLARRIGEGRALALTLTGETINAERALTMGLCDRVVSDDLLESEAASLAQSFADGAQGAIRATKRLMRLAPSADLEAALAAEPVLQQALGFHPHYRDAIIAFAAKQAPRFTHEEEA